MSLDYAKHLHLSIKMLKEPRRLFNVDGTPNKGLGWASEKIERSEIFERAVGARQRRYRGDEDSSRPCFVLKTLQSAGIETQFKPLSVMTA